MANPLDDRGNVQVDFVWGNFPLQPDDARPSGKKLNAALDNHAIATEGWSGFPGFIPNSEGDGDAVPNVKVPVLTGVLEATALTRLTNAGLVGVAGAVTTDGATEANDGKVASQTPAAGSYVNEGANVTYSLYSAGPAALLGPTTNWYWNGMNGRFNFNDETSVPQEMSGSAAMGYKLVIVGGSWAGEYNLGNATTDAGIAYVQIQGGFPAGSMSVDGTVDGGTASVVPV